MKQITKVLTFRASSIGDCLMARYFLENIHIQFPEAKLGIVVSGRAGMIRDLVADVPWLEVVEANRRDLTSLHRLWRDWRGSELIVTQYAGKHGGAFGLMSKFAARLLARRGGLVGFADSSPWNRFLYDVLLEIRRDWAVAEHEREALRAAGLGVPLPYPLINPPTHGRTLNTFGLVKKSYIIVHPFAGNAGRSLSPLNTRELIQEIRRVLPEHTVLLSGGPKDKEQAEGIAKGLDGVQVLAGSANLQEMLRLISNAAAIVSVDTGVAHLAAHLRQPLVVLRTCLGPNWWFEGQYGKGIPAAQFSKEELCTPHVYKDYPDCLNKIPLAEVAAACARMVALIQ